MEAHSSPTVRTDIDILADIQAIIQGYPPLVHDRGHLTLTVENGAVTLRGHVRSLNTRDYFLEGIQAVDGVISIDSDRLYVDETTRLQLGQVVPVGISANVEYGTVILSGKLESELSEDALAARVGRVHGVRRVVMALRN